MIFSFGRRQKSTVSGHRVKPGAKINFRLPAPGKSHGIPPNEGREDLLSVRISNFVGTVVLILVHVFRVRCIEAANNLLLSSRATKQSDI